MKIGTGFDLNSNLKYENTFFTHISDIHNSESEAFSILHVAFLSTVQNLIMYRTPKIAKKSNFCVFLGLEFYPLFSFDFEQADDFRLQWERSEHDDQKWIRVSLCFLLLNEDVDDDHIRVGHFFR